VTLAASAEDRPLVGGIVPEGLTVAFGAGPAEGATVVRFAGEARRSSELLVAPRADGVWRSSPWPAADDLFDLALPAAGARTLVVDPQPGRRGEAGRLLRDQGIDAVLAERLRRHDLEQAATVLFLDDAAFPATLPAVAAAGRLVVLPDVRPVFGWQDGVDCLVGARTPDLVRLAVAAAARPRAFDALRAMARITARPYRASDVYARFALDVSLDVGVPS
jgi:hypothetical protein